MLADPRTFVHGAGGVVNLDSSSLLSVTRFRSPYHRHLSSGPQAHVRPQEKSARCCQFEIRNNSEFIARNSAFYRPKLALIGQLHIT